MRTPTIAILFAALAGCANTPQWDECSREECSTEVDADCLTACRNEGRDHAECYVECAPATCRGGCGDGYVCVAPGGRSYCAQECETAADCTDLGAIADGETICAAGCAVTCRYGHGDNDCPPETHCVGADAGGRDGNCLP